MLGLRTDIGLQTGTGPSTGCRATTPEERAAADDEAEGKAPVAVDDGLTMMVTRTPHAIEKLTDTLQRRTTTTSRNAILVVRKMSLK
jgi:hypothetical protein